MSPFFARPKLRTLLPLLLLSVCAMHAAPAPNSLPGYVIVPLGRGHTNRLCLAVTVSGIKGLAMLDTGASGTALSDSTFHGLLTSGAKLPAGVPKTSTINGLSAPVVMASDFKVSDITIGSFPVRLAPKRYLYNSAIGSGGDRTYDLLLGEEFLRHFRAVVDCGRLALYLNTDPAKHLSLTSAFTSGGWTRVPMTDLGNDFTVPCSLNGHTFRLIVDTGAGFSVVNHGQVNAMGLEGRDIPGFHSGLIGTAAKTSGVATIDGLQIGGYVATTTHMITTDEDFTRFAPAHDESQDGTLAGLLGPDLLASNGAIST